MRIGLHMNGRNVFFSNKDIISKAQTLKDLERIYSAQQDSNVEIVPEIVSKPTEGKYFEVAVSTFDEIFFEKERTDFMQEWTRKCILSALAEVKKKPQKYARPFVTFLPKKTWHYKTVHELKQFAQAKGGHLANWVEQSMEWTQRLMNGESWESLCNSPDTSNWYRLVIWKKHHAQIVGGSSLCNDILPPTTVFGNHSHANDILYFTVPLIVIYL